MTRQEKENSHDSHEGWETLSWSRLQKTPVLTDSKSHWLWPGTILYSTQPSALRWGESKKTCSPIPINYSPSTSCHDNDPTGPALFGHRITPPPPGHYGRDSPTLITDWQLGDLSTSLCAFSLFNTPQTARTIIKSSILSWVFVVGREMSGVVVREVHRGGVKGSSTEI